MLVSVAIFAFSMIPSAPALAQSVGTSTFNCPVGWTCTPTTTPPVFVCPAGYICTPITTPPQQATSTAYFNIVGQPTLSLTYNSARQESALTAVFNINVYGGTTGVNVNKYAEVSLTDSQGNFYNNVNSQRTTVTSSQANTTTDNYGDVLFVVPAGQMVPFIVTYNVNPQQIFAGTYTATIQSLYGIVGTDLSNQFQIGGGKGIDNTNTKTIVGEVSPYITSVTNPIYPGQTMSISGQRLNGVSILIDGATVSNITVIGVSSNNNSLSFQLPTTVAAGSHTLSVNNPTTGSSNLVGFQVSGAITPPPATTTPVTNSISFQAAFNKTFNISSVPSTATLSIAADNDYVVYVNGTYVGSGASDGSSFYSPTTYNVAQYLHAGPNTIQAVGQNFYSTFTSWPSNAMGLIFKISDTYGNTLVASNGSETISSATIAGGSVGVISQPHSWWTTAVTGASWIWDTADPLWQTYVNYTGTPTTAVCPAGYVCSAPGTVLACPAGYTCTPVAITTCPTGYTCYSETPTTTQPPVISGGTFPTTLTIGQTGTWIVKASDPQNSSLSYSVNWGDTSSCPAGYTCTTPAASASVQSSSFTHSYSSAGTYTVTFTVTDSAGLSAKTSTAVTVTAAQTTTPARLSLDASSPQTQIVLANSTGAYLGLPVLVFDLGNTNSSGYLRNVTVHFSIPGNITTAYLYQGSNLIRSTAVSGGIATLSIPTNASPIPANVTVPYMIKVDVNGVNTGSIIFAASVSAGDISLQTSNGSVIPISGSATGYPITIKSNTIIENSSSPYGYTPPPANTANIFTGFVNFFTGLFK
jgi:hypothetical protein